MGELNVDFIATGLTSLPELGSEILAKDFELTLGSASAIFAISAGLTYTLGEMTGSARETVTRALDELQRQGFVQRRGRTYSVCVSPEELVLNGRPRSGPSA